MEILQWEHFQYQALVGWNRQLSYFVKLKFSAKHQKVYSTYSSYAMHINITLAVILT